MGICSSKRSPRRNHHLEIRNNDDFAGQRHNLANITSVTIHQGVTIEQYAFYGCTGLTSLVISQGVTIEQYAFYGCTGLTSLVISQGVKIERIAFQGCTGLTSLVISQGVTIEPAAFNGCTGLTSLVIPQGVTIEVAAFNGCTSLTSLVIPQGVTIERFAFYGCTGLTSLVISQGVKIEPHAFNNCTGLTSVYAICNPEQEAGWIAQNFQGKFDRNGIVELKFIPERLVNGIINRIRLHLPGQYLERLVIPDNLTEVLNNTQSNNSIPLSLHPSRKLLYNNHLAGQLQRRQRLEIQSHIKALLLLGIRLAHAEVGAQLPQEIWESILSYLFYQAIGADNFRILMRSLFTPGHVRRDEKGISFLAIKPSIQ